MFPDLISLRNLKLGERSKWIKYEAEVKQKISLTHVLGFRIIFVFTHCAVTKFLIFRGAAGWGPLLEEVTTGPGYMTSGGVASVQSRVDPAFRRTETIPSEPHVL